MLDIHTVSGTPGATTALAALNTTPSVNDGAPVAGIPIRTDARLILWGSTSLVANTIYLTQLLSQDQIDSINGEVINLGTAGLRNEMHKFTNLPYKQGARNVGQTTNTAQSATSLAILLDHYSGGPVIGASGLRFAPNQLALRQTLNVNVAITWVSTGFAPAQPIPNGKYALLGVYVAVLTDPAVIRFQHADFQGLLPGFPIVEGGASSILGLQKGTGDKLMTDQGYQFVTLSEVTGKPCVPVFTVNNAATGLIIQMIAPTNTDTPQLTLNLVKVA